VTVLTVSINRLSKAGVEVLGRGNLRGTVKLPEHSRIEAPASLKWTEYAHSLSLGAFSYQVSGYCFAARIGRYCSFGEDVQIGRQDHPTGWVSSSPAFYEGGKLFDVGEGFTGAAEFSGHEPITTQAPTQLKVTRIGHDVWIGHGAYIRAGVTISNGAVVAARAVVVKDVPPYALVAGNPATIRKFRLPPTLIGRMVRSGWWRFAPWQIGHLDVTKPVEFLNGIYEMKETSVFEPSVVNLADGSWT
jgi:chloramphenicol O-acetyltransferase type B